MNEPLCGRPEDESWQQEVKPEHMDAKPPPNLSAEQNKSALVQEVGNKQDDKNATQHEQGNRQAAPTHNAGRVLKKHKTDDIDEDMRAEQDQQAPAPPRPRPRRQPSPTSGRARA